MDPWVWTVMLLVVALSIGVLELVIPSGGALTILAVLALIASIVTAFWEGPIFGLLYSIGVFTGMPLLLYFLVKWWPKTPMGKAIMLEARPEEDVIPDSSVGLKHLVGQRGKARTKMLPAGAIVIDGHTYDAFSEGPPISPGEEVLVVRVQGTHITVRRVDGETPPPGGETSEEKDSLKRAFNELQVEDPFADDDLLKEDGQG